MTEQTTTAVKICAILLAAGESKRMGEQNKLLLDVNGEPLLHRTARILLGSSLTEIIVVTGHQADRVSALVNDLPVTIVHNDKYTEGQMTSVHAGMAVVPDDCDAVMICLADQPLLESVDVDALIQGFAEQTEGSVLVPTFQGQRGNPIVLACEHRDAILAGDRNLGCRKLIEKNPQLVTTLAMATNHVVVDMDTPEDYAGVIAAS